MTKDSLSIMVLLSVAAVALVVIGAKLNQIIEEHFAMRRKAAERIAEENRKFTEAIAHLITEQPIYLYVNGHMTRCMNIRVDLSENGMPTGIYVMTDADDVYQVTERGEL